jgi:hypothetical protein
MVVALRGVVVVAYNRRHGVAADHRFRKRALARHVKRPAGYEFVLVDRQKFGVAEYLYGERRRAEPQRVSRSQRRVRDAFRIDERAVGASLILDGKRIAAPLQARVLARNRGVRNDDIATGLSADQGVRSVDENRVPLEGNQP